MKAKTETETRTVTAERRRQSKAAIEDPSRRASIALQLAELAEELAAVLLVGVDAFDL